MRSKLASVLGAFTLAAGAVVALAPTVSAADACWQDGYRHWCRNVAGAPVYGTIGNNHIYPDPTTVVGHMNSNPSWFYCKMDGQDWVGGPHPTRWLMTVADNGQLGFMKDTDIYSETDPVRDC
ncbi:hypothetical protein [Streptomyces boluensis]|uniref:Secreted protein n=1 Tax=Streptomyces boluensis TaxID=1775135 RepID=A0A964XMH0_9ACTN|nr:hypothetical protein [Streptomyces boluensis]NBE54385.1 hypothetical protein [Streptomyces boluensis]